jgi:predicted AAA+ superfamily ATPase
VQLAPELFRAIKAAVDRDRRPRRFLLTGSSRLIDAQDMADALVGRVEPLELWPFSQSELEGSPGSFVERVFEDPRDLIRNVDLDRRDLIRRILAGGFPEATRRTAGRRGSWFDSYVATTTRSVIRSLSQIERLAEIPKLLRLCAARTATELNVSAIASDLAMPVRTMDGYLALLSTAFLIRMIPAWSRNLSSKVVRRPKLMLMDSGLASHLVGATEASLARPEGPLGQLLETFVTTEIIKQATWSPVRPSIGHFRDRGGAEVDLVLEHPDGRVVGVEIKATSTPREADFRGLRFVADRLEERFHFGVLFTAAPEATPFGSRFAALPVSLLWS